MEPVYLRMLSGSGGPKDARDGGAEGELIEVDGAREVGLLMFAGSGGQKDAARAWQRRKPR
jgi:hypothetical protein